MYCSSMSACHSICVGYYAYCQTSYAILAAVCWLFWQFTVVMQSKKYSTSLAVDQQHVMSVIQT